MMKGCATWLCCVCLLSAVTAVRADEVRASAADVALLKQLLAGAAAWDGDSPEALRKQQEALAARLEDAALRERVRKLLPEVERATLLHARTRKFLKDLETVKGTATTEPGGPPWLRTLVGDGPMRLFDRLTAIDLCDHSIPIKSGVKNERITDDWLERLRGLPDVRSLDVSVTVVKGPGLKHIGTLKSLESLNLTLTLVTDEHLGDLRELTGLQKLLIASTKCTGEGFKDLGGLKNLVNLNCHSSAVNDAGLEQICRLTGLERIEIVHTHFTDKGAAHLARLTNMKRIQLGSRQATGAAVAPLRAMKQLRELDLFDGLVNAEGVKYASEIHTLTVLRLYAGPVGDDGFRPVARLTDLEVLIAQGVQITDAALDHLAGLKKLKRLEIQGNRVSDAAVTRLKQALPNLEVVK
jgi:hypothetical protein